ncbi:hypothetical protein H4R24_005248 [Coemansia sp. RSA 988]|nr:hypothetical protein H4R24_005248 [Coemansia sp. RSA 988]
MSATITLSSSLRPLRLLSSQSEKLTEPAASDGSSASNTQPYSSSNGSSLTSSSSNGRDEAEAAAVDTLAQRLWDAGRIGERQSSGVSSKLLFDAEALCDDAPYVCVDRVAAPALQQRGAWRKRFAAACGEDGQQPFVRVSGPNALPSTRRAQAVPLPQCSSPAPLCSPLIHPQPISNPFRTMMRSSGPSTALPTSLACQQPRERSASSASLRPHPPPPTPRAAVLPPLTAGAALTLADPCIHCKRGNFLEFCFAADRCRCTCHDACPCNPCMDIRRLRPSLTLPSAASHRRLSNHPSANPSTGPSASPSRAQSTTASGSSLRSAPSSPACVAAELLDSAKFPVPTDTHSAAWHQQLPNTAPLLECSDNS